MIKLDLLVRGSKFYFSLIRIVHHGDKHINNNDNVDKVICPKHCWTGPFCYVMFRFQIRYIKIYQSERWPVQRLFINQFQKVVWGQFRSDLPIEFQRVEKSIILFFTNYTVANWGIAIDFKSFVSWGHRNNSMRWISRENPTISIFII